MLGLHLSWIGSTGKPQNYTSDYRREKHRRSGRLNFSDSTTELPSARHYDSDSLIRTTLIAIDRRGSAIASVRSIGFALHCRRNKSWHGPARRMRVQMSTTAVAGGRKNRDFRLPPVLFRCGRQTGALSTCTREIRRKPRRLPLDGQRTCGGIDPDTPLWAIELFFFASTAACPDCALQPWFERTSKCAKIVHLSVVLSHERTYEF